MFDIIFMAIFCGFFTYGIKLLKEKDSFGWFYVIFNGFTVLVALVNIIRN